MNQDKKVSQIAIEDIIPNRFQPRLAFDEEGLKELSESIKQHGIIQPIILRRLGNKYEIIAGERRYKAATMAGLKSVPAIISEIDDNQSAEMALVENIQRRNLTSIEEAKSYKNLLDRGYMTQEELASKMGVSQSTIANKLRLLNLSPEVQDALLKEKISERHARSLLAVPKEEQASWLKKIIAKRMTVRQLDIEIKKEKGEETTEDSSSSSDNMPNNPPKEEELIIPTLDEELETIEPEETKEKSSIIPNKFFNFLEDEAANMNLDLPTKNNFEGPQNIEELEVLGDFEPVGKTFFTNQNNQSNTILEVQNQNKEQIIDPIDVIDKIDPQYEVQKKEEANNDLKIAINDIRNLVEKLNDQGFEVKIDEIDLEENYQITINIQK